MRRTAGSHEVLRMHLEPADVGRLFEDLPVVLGLQPAPARTVIVMERSAVIPIADYIGCMVPLRFMPSLSVTSIDAQVPLATYFQALAS